MRHVNEHAGAVPPPGAGAARPATPLGLAIRRFGNRVPVQVIHACNCVTPDRLADLRLRSRRQEIQRRAEAERRAREDARALQVDMDGWWREVTGE